MVITLSEGSLKKLMNGDDVGHPNVQIVGLRKMNPKGSTADRYRMVISDGLNSINFAMLGTQLNPKVEAGDLVENAIITLKHTIISKIKDKSGEGERKVIIILDCELLVPGSEVNEKIGSPIPLSEDQKENADVNQASASVPVESKPPVPAPTMPNKSVSPAGEQPAKKPRLEMGQQDVNIRPINSINPFQNKWVIKARVMVKSQVRTWSNAKGEGKLFSMDLKDSSGEIRATAFKEEVDKFYNFIEVEKVYLIGNCVVKTANKKFSNLKHDYEISFTRDTFVNEVEDDSSVPKITLEHVPIESIKDSAVDTMIDVVGVCQSAAEVQNLISRATSRELKKRDIVLVDDSRHSINLTLWGEQAVEFDGSNHPIVAVRNARVSEYQSNKNLTTAASTSIVTNPDIPVAHQLKGWYENGGCNLTFTAISAGGGGSGGGSYGFEPWKCLSAMKDERMGQADKPDYMGVVAHIMAMRKDNCYYLACPTEDCKKKVQDNNNGLYRCEKCNKDYQDVNPRMILSVNIADWTSNTWVTLFDNEARLLLGVDGRELIRLKDEQPEKYNAVFDAARFKEMQFKLRVKQELYNDESRIKASVVKMEELNLNELNERLLKEINEMRAKLNM